MIGVMGVMGDMGVTRAVGVVRVIGVRSHWEPLESWESGVTGVMGADWRRQVNIGLFGVVRVAGR